MAIGILVSIMMSGVTSQNRDLVSMYTSQLRHLQIMALAENIEQYALENSNYPATLTILKDTPGFTHTSGLNDNWQGYKVSSPLTDDAWQYKRAALTSNNPATGTDAASYLTANTCGTGTFDTASSWCGSATGEWFRTETREKYNDQIATQRIRMGRLLQKLANYYNANTQFPSKDNSNTALAVNNTTKLTDLIGASALTATNCTGERSYQGVPIDCNDLFDIWGTPIGYQFMGIKHIVLISESPIKDQTGTRIVIGADFDNTLIL